MHQTLRHVRNRLKDGGANREDCLTLATVLENHGEHPNVVRYLRERVKRMYHRDLFEGDEEVHFQALDDAPPSQDFDFSTIDGLLFPVEVIRELLRRVAKR